MEPGYIKGDSSNLPKLDSWMIHNFYRSNPDFCSAEFRNVKTTASSRQSYGDQAIGYVQLKREEDKCVILCKITPEHKVNQPPYKVEIIINIKEEIVEQAKCYGCPASEGGCKHAVAFLMWLHRRSEEPSTTEVQCYWQKPKLAKVGSTLKFMKTHELASSEGLSSRNPANEEFFNEFVEIVKNGSRCHMQISNYVHYFRRLENIVSLHIFIADNYYGVDGDVDVFLNLLDSAMSEELVEKTEANTRGQAECKLWHEVRYGRVTASKAYEVSRCKTSDGSLVERILGAKLPKTKAMIRGIELEDSVRNVVQKRLNVKIKQTGIYICLKNPMIAASPDGINKNNNTIFEIKCPKSEKTYPNYICQGKITEKFFYQMQLQMHCTNTTKGYFCVAHWEFEKNSQVELLCLNYDKEFVEKIIKNLVQFWKTNIFPRVYKSAAYIENKK